MNHQAWYRQLRPRKFAEIVGQDDIVKILKNSIINQNFNHAYLFSGSKGTGKTSVAKIFARAINCENNQKGEACELCVSCQKMFENQEHVDILEIDGASNNGVDEIRAIRKNVNILPMELKCKIYIIDEVHMLTIPAFNALLKTLEEPPKHIVFIFATTEPNKVPETIISRCQWFAFKRIELEMLETTFIKILKTKAIAFETAAICEIALLAGGSLRDGINHLEKIYNFGEKISLANVTRLFNLISINDKIDFLVAFYQRDFEKFLTLLHNFNLHTNDFKQVLFQIFQILLDITLYKTTKSMKTARILKKSQILIFDFVNLNDVKMVLNELVNILNTEGNNHLLFSLTLAKLVNICDKFDYNNVTITKINKKDNTILEKVKKNSEEILKSDDKIQNQPENVQKSVIPNINLPDLTKLNQTVLAKKTEIDSNWQSIIINVLVQADVKTRKLVKTAWLKINELISQNKFRNLGKIYLGTNISAAAKNAVIVICDNTIQSELINKKFAYKEHRDFLKFVLGKEYMLFALDKKQWKAIGQFYQSQCESNNLPKPTEISIPPATMYETTESKSETLMFLKKFFTEIEEI